MVWRFGFTREKYVYGSIVATTVLIAFLFHFQWWNGPLLEEWVFISNLNTQGLHAISLSVLATMGRPLHTLPVYLGGVLTPGSALGMYFVLGGVAAFQVIATAWALRPALSKSISSWLLGLLLALHPWWTGGDVIRFLPAQVSLLFMLIWLGSVIRYLKSGQNLWLAGSAIAVVVGLMTYQALAFVYLFGVVAACLSLRQSFGRRANSAVVSTGLSVLGCLVYSIFVAPKLFPSYEAELLGGSSLRLWASMESIFSTEFHFGSVLFVFAAAVLAIVLVLSFRSPRGQRIGYVFLIWMVPLSTFSALIYMSTSLHLNDPERVFFPIGVSLWLVLTLAIVRAGIEWSKSLTYALSVLTLVAIFFSALNLQKWAELSDAQERTLSIVSTVINEVSTNYELVLVDETGKLGDIYTFYGSAFSTAIKATFGAESPPGIICTADVVERKHPYASRYPLTTTEFCSAVLSPDAVKLGEGTIPAGKILIYAQPITR
jgi:hypothetical protein